MFETGVVVGPRGLEFEYQQTWAHQFWDSSVQHESQTWKKFKFECALTKLNSYQFEGFGSREGFQKDRGSPED